MNFNQGNVKRFVGGLALALSIGSGAEISAGYAMASPSTGATLSDSNWGIVPSTKIGGGYAEDDSNWA
ncbi:MULTISPECIES: hypothetical protein [unclassified Streptomyces]|uniref:hypothetical protein n=1 Tax=unclassified Streptomyces TaxID=2593676 RepID=UPI001BE667F7|nr:MULTISPECIES: hypothetical protein [unclassified Streptomyces]MBT2454439.1 hypothetical protein [Streptomyces sp. ISL-86]